MKKISVILATMLVAFVCSTQASARGVIVYHLGEDLKITQKLPAECIGEDNMHYNLGVHYESFGLFWMPVWNYGEYKYALINDKEDTYIDLTLEEAKAFGKKYKFDVPDQPQLPLLTQIGLKPIIVILIILAIIGLFKKKKKEEEDILNQKNMPTDGTNTPPTTE